MHPNHRSSFTRAAQLTWLTVPLVACGDADGPTDPNPLEHPLIVVDLPDGVARPATLAAHIPWRFTNPLPDTLYFLNCLKEPGPLAERLDDGVWVAAFASVTPLCGRSFTPIAPGETWTDTIVAALNGKRLTNTGTYRLNWNREGSALFRSAERDGGAPSGASLPRDFSIVSQPFELIDPRDRP